MEIILSSSNPSKIVQIRPFFNGLPVTLLTLREAGIDGDAVEDGATLEENALKKAHFAWQAKGGWTLADDTGLFIDALDGRPGIHAARWAGEVPTDAITSYTLEQLAGVPLEKRTATFETVAALVDPMGHHYVFSGKIRGHLRFMPLVPPQPKMPYSGLFVPEGETRAWAQMTTEEENAISHRGKAFRQVCRFLEQYAT